MLKKPTLSDQLYFKMKKELDAFKADLMTKPPKDILDAAYELTLKEDLLCIFEMKDRFSDKECRALLKCKAPLDYLYQEWMDTDVTYMDVLRDSVQMSVDKQVELIASTARTSRGSR